MKIGNVIGTMLECDGQELREDGTCPKCERIMKRIEGNVIAPQIATLRAACEAAQVFVHLNSPLCEYGEHSDLCQQLRAALEDTKL